MISKYDSADITLDEYGYSEWMIQRKIKFEGELDDLPPQEGDDEISKCTIQVVIKRS